MRKLLYTNFNLVNRGRAEHCNELLTQNMVADGMLAGRGLIGIPRSLSLRGVLPIFSHVEMPQFSPKKERNKLKGREGMLHVQRAPISFVLNWYTPTSTATDVKHNV